MLLGILNKSFELLNIKLHKFTSNCTRFYAAVSTKNEYENLLDKLKSKVLLDCKGDLIQADVAFKRKPILAYYFSASWCTPCKQLLPKIRAMYKECHDKSNGFELLYVSMDEKEDIMIDYFKQSHGCDWYAIPFGDTSREYLVDRFGIENVPQIIILRVKDGSIITRTGRKDIEVMGKDVLLKWNPEAK